MSAPRTAASTFVIGSIGTAHCRCISFAKRFALSKLRAAIRTRLSGRATDIADRCERGLHAAADDCQSPASSRANRRVASALTAAVRIAVIAEAFNDREQLSGLAVEEHHATLIERPFQSRRCGKTQIAFKPNRGDGLVEKVGIMASTPLTPGGLKIVRHG